MRGSKSRVLVTGGAGFIGSHLCDALIRRGESVRVLDDFSSGRRENLASEVEVLEGSIDDSELVAEALRDVESVFHLAAIASVEKSREAWASTSAVNIGGTVTLLESVAARRRDGIDLPVVFASSAAVYGSPERLPLKELDRCAPINAYGADKLAGELHAAVAGSVHGVRSFVLRFFNVYGPRQDPNSPYSGVASIFLRRALTSQPLPIFGDGLQTRDYVFVSDVVDALVSARELASTCAPVCNVCTGRGVTLLELAEIILVATSSRSAIVHHPARPGDIRGSIGDATLSQIKFAKEGCVPLEAGIGELVKSCVSDGF